MEIIPDEPLAIVPDEPQGVRSSIQEQQIVPDEPAIPQPAQGNQAPIGGDVGAMGFVLPKEIEDREREMWTSAPGTFKGEEFDMGTLAGRYLHWKHNTSTLGGMYADPEQMLTQDVSDYGKNVEWSAKDSRWSPMGLLKGAVRGLADLGGDAVQAGALINRPFPWSKTTSDFARTAAQQTEGLNRATKYGSGTIGYIVPNLIGLEASAPSKVLKAGAAARIAKSLPGAAVVSAATMGAPAVERTLGEGGSAGEAIAMGLGATAVGTMLPTAFAFAKEGTGAGIKKAIGTFKGEPIVPDAPIQKASSAAPDGPIGTPDPIEQIIPDPEPTLKAEVEVPQAIVPNEVPVRAPVEATGLDALEAIVPDEPTVRADHDLYPEEGMVNAANIDTVGDQYKGINEKNTEFQVKSRQAVRHGRHAESRRWH